MSWRVVRKQSQQNDVFTVKKPGQGRSLQSVLADGRCTGHYKLQEKNLHEVPPVWDEAFMGKENSERWWDAVETVSLDLSRNQITTVPKEIEELSASLQILDLSHNSLEQLPECLSALTCLRQLRLSGNRLRALPDALAAIGGLQRLECADNQLTALPGALGSVQPSLQHVNISNNMLTVLPCGFSAATSLLTLDVSGNRLSALPEGIFARMTNHTHLNLSRNAISGGLPADISNLKRLSLLDVSRNQLAALPEGISCCTALVELLLEHNCLEQLPDSIQQLQSLRTLNIRGNRMRSFPEAACYLRLTLLDLTDNDLNALPPALGRMTTLRALPLSGNPIRGLRINQPVSGLLKSLRNRLEEEEPSMPSASAADAMAHLSEIAPGTSRLCLADQSLEKLPGSFWQSARDLKDIDLHNNQLTDFPSQNLSECSKLQVLNLSRNRLKEWPLPEAGLPALGSLDLSFNPGMTSIPLSSLLSCSASMQHLDLSGVASVCSIADSLLGGLPNLATLRLAQCRLAACPALTPGTANKSLRVLDVSANDITQVPEAVTTLQALEELNVANNSLSGLPPRLGLLAPRLRVLMLDGNPLRAIRRPVLERGTQGVLQYLRDRIVQ